VNACRHGSGIARRIVTRFIQLLGLPMTRKLGRFQHILSALAVLLVVISSRPFAADASETRPAPKSAKIQSPIGRKIENFTLRDFRGKETSFDDFKDAPVVVVAFLGTECPLVNLYAGRLNDLAKKYADKGVATIVINSNVQDSITEIAHWNDKHKLDIPVLKDAGNAIADKFGAVRTPEFFVLDRDRVIRYWGRFDDQYGIGYQRPEPTAKFLEAALEEVRAGKAVTRELTESIGCYIGRVKKPDETSEVTYSNQIARIFQKNCVECHREGEIGPFTLTSYEEAQGWAEMIDEVVREERMPPWHASSEHGKFRNDPRLSDEDKQLIHRWVNAGAPEGDKKQLPEPRKFAEGWRIGKPDVIVKINEKPFKVPAKGTVGYQYILVDPGFKEDKWILGAECKPGNAAVVHHIVTFVQTPDASKIGDDRSEDGPAKRLGTIESDWLAAYAPGSPPMKLPQGLAKFVPAGSKFVFQMHYTPNGTATTDVSEMGLIFADPAKVKKEVGTWRAVNPRFRIPPGAANHEVQAEHTFHKDTLLLAMFPHMHLRGKAFRYEAKFPDGRRQVLLDVPRYDFGWQNSYVPESPVLMPAGTKLLCTAHFDNSENNLSNPDPKATVTWGDQTWEEMMIGYFSMILVDQDLTKTPRDQSRVDRFRDDVKKTGAVKLSDETKKLAAEALESDEKLAEFRAALETLVPQLDRIDVTTVADGTLTIRRVSQSQDPLRKAVGNVALPAAKLAVAEYATRDKPTIHGDLSKEKAPDLVFAARMMASSAHIPVTIDGAKGTINFWSMERDAFPKEAIAILKEAAAALAK
jgi:peroxiredoxin/mono/diheme cytochrome c family protein